MTAPAVATKEETRSGQDAEYFERFVLYTAKPQDCFTFTATEKPSRATQEQPPERATAAAATQANSWKEQVERRVARVTSTTSKQREV